MAEKKQEEVVEPVEAEVAAEPEVEEEVVEEAKFAKGTKFFRSKLAGLTVVVGDKAPADPTTLDKVRFVPYEERWDGDRIKVGYLATPNKEAIGRLATDPMVEEIDEEEFVEKTTGKKSKRLAY